MMQQPQQGSAAAALHLGTCLAHRYQKGEPRQVHPDLIPNRPSAGRLFFRIRVQTLDGDDPDEFETRLKHLFIRHGWSMVDNRGHTVDPETQQLTATFYFVFFEIEN